MIIIKNKMLTDKILYILLIFANILGNICYKVFHTTAVDVLFYRHSILFISCLFIIFWHSWHKKLDTRAFDLYNKRFIFYNIMRTVTTFIAIIGDLQQIKQGGLLDTTLIYCSIPLFDLLFYRRKEENWKGFYLMLLANLLLLLYNIYFYHFYQYIYGYLASMFFSISNIFFLNSKREWEKNRNKFIILLDMTLFSFLTTVLAIGFFGFNTISPINLSITIVSLSGAIVTVLIYFLFFISIYNPSFVISNLDLILSLLIDVSVFSIFPSNITLFIALLMLYILYKRREQKSRLDKC